RPGVPMPGGPVQGRHLDGRQPAPVIRLRCENVLRLGPAVGRCVVTPKGSSGSGSTLPVAGIANPVRRGVLPDPEHNAVPAWSPSSTGPGGGGRSRQVLTTGSRAVASPRPPNSP